MKTFITYLTILVSLFTFSQRGNLTDEQVNNSIATKIMFANIETCVELDEWISEDFSKGIAYLFLQGGIAPVRYHTDKRFERKYKVHLYDFGCIAPNYKCVIEYNNRMFHKLTKQHGDKWLKAIRKDIIGLKEWKKKSSKIIKIDSHIWTIDNDKELLTSVIEGVLTDDSGDNDIGGFECYEYYGEDDKKLKKIVCHDNYSSITLDEYYYYKNEKLIQVTSIEENKDDKTKRTTRLYLLKGEVFHEENSNSDKNKLLLEKAKNYLSQFKESNY